MARELESQKDRAAMHDVGANAKVKQEKRDSAPRRPIPTDLELVGLGRMLDPHEAGVLIVQSLGWPQTDLRECEITYVRYKPQTNCIVGYLATIDDRKSGDRIELRCYGKVYTAPDYENAAAKCHSHRWLETELTPPFLTLPELKTILYFYPNDFLLEGMRLLSDHRKVQRALYTHHHKYPEPEWRISDRKMKVETIRYKPERRAVLRATTRLVNRQTEERYKLGFYLRVYADNRGEEVFQIQRDLGNAVQQEDSLVVPYAIAYLPERRAILMEEVEGMPLRESLEAGDPTAELQRTAEALAALHRVDPAKLQSLPGKSAEDFEQELTASLSMLDTVLPESKELTGDIALALRRAQPDTLVGRQGFVHGDFHYSQVLLQKNAAAIIDYDRSYRGEVLADVANLCAYFELLQLEGAIGSEQPLREMFLAAYERATGIELDHKRLREWTGRSLLSLAIGPFRRLDSNWQQKTKEILERCQVTLLEN